MSEKQKQPQTQYVKMLLASTAIAPWWGRLAHFFSWVLLQGYVIFPSTFTTYDLAHLEAAPGDTSTSGTIKKQLFFLIRHVPLFWVAWGAVIIGGLGMFGCLLTFRRNYIWGLREVISPGFYAASTGLVSTVANIYGGPQKGQLSAASKLTLFVTGGATVFFGILWVIYKPILLGNAKKEHVEAVGNIVAGEHGQGRFEDKEPVEGLNSKLANIIMTQISPDNSN